MEKMTRNLEGLNGIRGSEVGDCLLKEFET